MGFQLQTNFKNTSQFCNDFHQSSKYIIKVMEHINFVLQRRMLCKNRWCNFQRLTKKKKKKPGTNRNTFPASWPPFLTLGYTFSHILFRENYALPFESRQICINLDAGSSGLRFIFYFLKNHQACDRDFENYKHVDSNIFLIIQECVYLCVYVSVLLKWKAFRKPIPLVVSLLTFPDPPKTSLCKWNYESFL